MTLTSPSTVVLGKETLNAEKEAQTENIYAGGRMFGDPGARQATAVEPMTQGMSRVDCVTPLYILVIALIATFYRKFSRIFTESVTSGSLWLPLVFKLQKIDADKGDALRLLAPRKFRTDAKKARGLLLCGHVFAGLNHEE